MKRLIPVIIIAILAVLSAFGENMVLVPEDDAEMNAAINKARATAGSFWKHFRRPGKDENNFLLKVEINDSNGAEHFWFSNIKLVGNVIYGTVSNDPEIVQCVKYGQTIKIDPEKISDWMYYREGKIVGGFTIRVLLKHFDEAERKYYESILGPEE